MAAAFAILYAPVFVDLARTWLTDENYSHGPLLAPVAAFIVWRRRTLFTAEAVRPSNAGLILVLGGLAALLVGTAGVEFFLMRTSALVLIAGIAAFIGGWQWMRLVFFPLSLLLLTIPMPPVIFYQAAFPLQLLATKFGVAALQVFDVPVLREGNIITLAQVTLEVTEACSGIRSLVSLSALATLYGYFTDDSTWRRAAISLSSVPIAIVANGLRVAGTGLAAHFIAPSTATGFFHAFSGWAVFMTSFVMLMAVARLLKATMPPFVRVQAEPSLA